MSSAHGLRERDICLHSVFTTECNNMILALMLRAGHIFHSIESSIFRLPFVSFDGY